MVYDIYDRYQVIYRPYQVIYVIQLAGMRYDMPNCCMLHILDVFLCFTHNIRTIAVSTGA